MSPYEEPGDSDKWYGQPAAGFDKLIPGEDFLWVNEFNQNPGNRNGQIQLTEKVLGKIAYWRGSGWVKWIAAEAQQNNDGANFMWVWPLDNRNKYLEFVAIDSHDYVEAESVLSLHGGKSWQFPFIVFFDSDPTERVLDVLRTYNVPYAVNPPFVPFPSDGEEEPPPPPEPDPDPDLISYWIEQWGEADITPGRWNKIHAKLDVLFQMMVIVLEGGE
jgi:hypothetical protein